MLGISLGGSQKGSRASPAHAGDESCISTHPSLRGAPHRKLLLVRRLPLRLGQPSPGSLVCDAAARGPQVAAGREEHKGGAAQEDWYGIQAIHQDLRAQRGRGGTRWFT